jgi:hypothetical protein
LIPSLETHAREPIVPENLMAAANPTLFTGGRLLDPRLNGVDILGEGQALSNWGVIRSATLVNANILKLEGPPVAGPDIPVGYIAKQITYSPRPTGTVYVDASSQGLGLRSVDPTP